MSFTIETKVGDSQAFASINETTSGSVFFLRLLENKYLFERAVKPGPSLLSQVRNLVVRFSSFEEVPTDAFRFSHPLWALPLGRWASPASTKENREAILVTYELEGSRMVIP